MSRTITRTATGPLHDLRTSRSLRVHCVPLKVNPFSLQFPYNQDFAETGNGEVTLSAEQLSGPQCLEMASRKAAMNPACP